MFELTIFFFKPEWFFRQSYPLFLFFFLTILWYKLLTFFSNFHLYTTWNETNLPLTIWLICVTKSINFAAIICLLEVTKTYRNKSFIKRCFGWKKLYWLRLSVSKTSFISGKKLMTFAAQFCISFYGHMLSKKKLKSSKPYQKISLHYLPLPK